MYVKKSFLPKIARASFLIIYIIITSFGLKPIIIECNDDDCCNSCETCITADLSNVTISCKCCDVHEETKNSADYSDISIIKNIQNGTTIYSANGNVFENYLSKFITKTSQKKQPSVSFKYTILRI